jgi:hypothetical protein
MVILFYVRRWQEWSINPACCRLHGGKNELAKQADRTDSANRSADYPLQHRQKTDECIANCGTNCATTCATHCGRICSACGILCSSAPFRT